MFKRKVEGSGDESPAKKNQTEAMSNPVPRHIPLQHVTLTFKQTSWEELPPGELWYLPLCQTPKYMFDQAMIQQFKKFKNLWGTMEIHTPKAKISNLVMLQDDLRVQNNTPTDATAFTQVIYMVKYCPQGQKQYFKLGSATDPGSLDATTDLTYTMKPVKPENNTYTQFTKLQNFASFENLILQPTKSDFEAGFVPGSNITFSNEQNLTIANPYIAPDSVSPLHVFSGNLNMTNDKFLQPKQTVTFARNQNKIAFYKYGDTFDIEINTNLEGVPLINNPANDFLEEQIVTVTRADLPNVSIQYEGEFCYPGRNRPFLCRKNYYDANTDPIIQGKQFKPLNHCFLCMPPIYKPGGQLLGQRCSFMLEQEISITFHMTQAVFTNDVTEDGMQMNQDNGVLLRRNFYPTPDLIRPPSVFCGSNAESQCKKEGESVPGAPSKCYYDSFRGLMNFFQDNPSLRNINKYCEFSLNINKPSSPYLYWVREGQWAGNMIGLKQADKISFLTAWAKAYGANQKLVLWWADVRPSYIDDNDNFWYIVNDNSKSKPDWENVAALRSSSFNTVIIDVKKMMEEVVLPNTYNECKIKSYAVANKVCNTFFV